MLIVLTMYPQVQVQCRPEPNIAHTSILQFLHIYHNIIYFNVPIILLISPIILIGNPLYTTKTHDENSYNDV